MGIFNKEKRRIGLFGGSFDPFHIGHLMLMKYAKQALNLDHIILIPCNESGYKNKTIGTSGIERLTMLNVYKAESFRKLFSIDPIEIERGGETYTIDTVKYFKVKYPHDYLCYIVGQDSEKFIPSWKNYEELIKLIDIKVAGDDFFFPDINIRSTMIRECIEKGYPIEELVPYAIYSYIKGNNLYKKEID